MQILFQLFNRIYLLPTPSYSLHYLLLPLLRSPAAINYIYRFSIYLFDQVANRAAGDRRAPESRSVRNVAPSSSPALCSAPFCWRPSSLPTPDPRTVGCALCKYICFSVAFQFAFFVILFHYLSFFSVVILLLPQQEQPQELWLVLYICITWLNVLTLQTQSICALCTRVLSARWGKILQG